eukprot:300571-Chlamydomonas_euryale.AAC.9
MPQLVRHVAGSATLEARNPAPPCCLACNTSPFQHFMHVGTFTHAPRLLLSDAALAPCPPRPLRCTHCCGPRAG